MPFPISTWLTTQSVQAIILMLVVAAVSTMIWYPFFKAFEKQQLEAEQEKAA
jgi:PTS system cellobiose-specific IIC component